jgi:hypothetical protein
MLQDALSERPAATDPMRRLAYPPPAGFATFPRKSSAPPALPHDCHLSCTFQASGAILALFREKCGIPWGFTQLLGIDEAVRARVGWRSLP